MYIVRFFFFEVKGIGGNSLVWYTYMNIGLEGMK